MASQNATLEKELLEIAFLEVDEEEVFDFEDLEDRLESRIEEELNELEFLTEEGEKIGNPDHLGEVVKEVVWEQFMNQIAEKAGTDFIESNHGMTLDLRNSAHIQTAENFAQGKIATHNHISKNDLEYNYNRYKNTPHKQFRKDHVNPGMDATLKRAGDLKKQGIDTVTDIYTGRQIPTETKLPNGKNNPKAAQREHVIPSAKIYDDPSLQMANSDKGLAGAINDPKNMGYTTADRNNRKSDHLSDTMDDLDKTKHWEKANETAEEHLDQKRKEGEDRLKKEGRKTQREEAFKIGGAALRAVAMQFLAELAKEIIAKLVLWFKNAKRTLATLLEGIKEAIHSFVGKLKEHLINAGSTVFSTVATAIIGPVWGTIKKVWMILKQGWQSLKNAVAYLRDPANKGKPIGRLLMETGKLVIAGMTGVSAIVLGELIEKGLMAIPGIGAVFAFEIPLIGSLANILGMLLGAIVAGIIGAVAINMIEKKISKGLKAESVSARIDKGNEILALQNQLRVVSETRLNQKASETEQHISERHLVAAQELRNSAQCIENNLQTDDTIDESFDAMEQLLNNLED